MLNNSHGFIRDAPLAGDTQLYKTLVIFYTENPLVCRKLQLAEANLSVVDVLDFFNTRIKITIRAPYCSKCDLISKMLILKN
jgi:hypothetical protein